MAHVERPQLELVDAGVEQACARRFGARHGGIDAITTVTLRPGEGT